MNTATKNLEIDHEYILRLIDVIDIIKENTLPDITHLEMIVDLIRNYADGFHHAKEEEILFPQLTEKGFSLNAGPVAVMLHEHTLGRQYVKNVSDAIQQYKSGKGEMITVIFENLSSYGSLLRGHIAKENNVLFRMADQVLSPEEQQELLRKFGKVENSKLCGGVLQDCINGILQLEKIYQSK
jgi:hemerythrin-like domain-containing protein